MTQSTLRYFTPKEYLELEEASLEKNEYHAGLIFQMAACPIRHGLIQSNVNCALMLAFRGRGWKFFDSQLKVDIAHPRTFLYPDASAVEDVVTQSPDTNTAIVDPILLVEVLSPATARYDEGSKFELYKKLPSFKHYLLIEISKVEVRYYFKTDGQWREQTFRSPSDVLKINGLDDVSLKIADFYDQVDFELGDD